MVKPLQEEPTRGFPLGTVVDGRYRVARFIGQGGAGLVHEVEHVRTGRRLALKTLLDEAGYARLEQEAKATSLMKNSHAVKITDMGTAQSGIAAGPYMVMELLEGQSLRALLDDAGQLPVELCVNIALQVCECLAEAHEHGIIHRDLKPENVVLAPSPWPGQYDVKVLDFGVVKISVDGPIPHSSLTRTGSTVGTPYYMSLEQLRNSSAVDARADIYALGVVMYECMSGRKPFEADTIGDLVYALVSGPPTPLSRLRPDAPADVCEVVARALSTRREDRQASMREVAAALLPQGNSAFGLWLRQESRRTDTPPSRQARPLRAAPPPAAGSRPEPPAAPAPPATEPAGARPASSEPPTGAWTDPVAPRLKSGPPGIPRPASAAPPRPDAPSPPRSATGPQVTPPPGALQPPAPASEPSGARAAPAERPVPARIPEAEAASEAEPEAGTADHEAAPPLHDDRDRDTPTEMYMKAVHDSPTEEIEHPGDRDTPTRALDRPLRLAAEVDADPETLTATRGEDPYAAYGPTMPGPPPDATRDAPNAIMHPTLRLPSPSMPPPAFDPAAPERPGWQRSLDDALVRVGNGLERTARAASTRFREASPRAQLLITMSAASLVTALLVLSLYLIFR